MNGLDPIDALAAEYALGTLDAAERAEVAARRQREPALDRAIREWEERLAPLAETMPALAPSADLLPRILARIDAVEDRQGRGTGPVDAIAGSGADVVELTRRLRTWRRIGLAASALAASLVLAIGVREWTRPDDNYIAVFQRDDLSPAFLMTVDLKSRQLTVRMVSAKPPPGKTFQLWIATDRLGPRPRSLGLIENAEFTIQKAAIVDDPAVLRGATFGVSLEPAGGSPTGQPTGEVFHAKLIRTAP